MEKEDINQYVKKNIKENDNNKIKLNYDYHSYENIIINNPKIKNIDTLLPKKENNIPLNSNKSNNNINLNNLKKNSLTEISLNKNTDININSKYASYKEFINDNEEDNLEDNYEDNNEPISINEQRYIQTTRNNINHSSNRIKENFNLIEKDFRNIMKQKEYLENKLNINDLNIDSKEKKYFNINNDKTKKKKEESKDFQTLELISKQNIKNNRNKNSNTINNNIRGNYLLTNEDLDFNVDNDINDIKKDFKNLRTNKSNPRLNNILETDFIDDYEDRFELKNKTSRKYLIKDKYEILYKEHFILKTKYEILKNNMKILEKKIKQKNYDISQMKKVLLSNNQQINFLTTLKDSNLKTLKDNEDLITNLKNAITNLNSKIVEYKNKLSIISQNQYQTLKKENESLKIYLNDRDKTISSLKNSLSFLTQNIDNILNKPNNNEHINDCDEKIKEQINQKIIELNLVKNKDVGDKYEYFNKILKEKNSEIEGYKNNIKELNENMNNKNQEIIQIKNNYEKIKQLLEEKEKELEERNIKIKELNNTIEKRNNEVNDIKKILDMKNLEIEERKKKFDFKIINQSSLEFYSQRKKYEVEVNNNKNFETQTNVNKNNYISDNYNISSITSNKINTDNNLEKNNTNNKFFIKKIKNSNYADSKNKNHLNKDLLFNNRSTSNNKSKIKTNFEYANYGYYFDIEPKIKKNISNFNFRKNKSNKNFNTIIGNNLFVNKSSNIISDINKDSDISANPVIKLRLYNDNDEDIKKMKYSKPNIRFRKNSPNLLLSTSTISVSKNESIKSITYPEKSTTNHEYIYSLINSDLICFNLKQKKFEILKIKDNTRGIYTSYISYYRQNKLQPLLLNASNNFYILMQKYIFIYDSSLTKINILTKTFSSHLNGNFIQIENNLYLISGNNNTQCELYSLIMNENKILPSTHIPRINSGICNINNEFIYVFFGQFCENSIERLNIKNLNYDKKWQIIKIKEINGINNKSAIYLEKFISFLDDYNNIIIFGGQDYNNEKCNRNIFGFNLNDKSFSTIGKIDSCALYGNQYIKLDESIFSVFDENNGLHFFSKELDYHEIFNLNI